MDQLLIIQELLPEELEIIQQIRSLRWGKIEIEVKDSVIVMVHKIQDIKLGVR